jgi:hypothetical protein
MSGNRSLVLRGVRISEDAYGNICLDDIWRLAKVPDSKLPKHWRTSRSAEALTAEVRKKVTSANLKEDKPLHSVLYAKRGRGNVGTFAHPILAAAYAGYLSPKLEIEVREIWLRYRAGDATLADEILQRASAEANEWAGVRAMARAQRVRFTDTLKDHGVQGRGYMDCTEALYMRLLGAKSFQLRAERGLQPKTNLRDHMRAGELSFVMAAEALSSERIDDEDCRGNQECERATSASASAIRRAIEEDRRSRQRKML